MRSLLKLLILLLFTVNLRSQFNEYYPEYEWLTLSGEHVNVHYHQEAERTAKVVLKIAEEVWEPITTLYQYEPDKVDYVIKDIDDYANGATYFFDNKIEIWASALDFDLRGSHNWLRNVISHEFTHMVQIQAALKMGRGIPAVYFQYLNYEDVRRPDILYGYPNYIVSYPLATLNVPAWFAEGTAQYMRKEFDYDNWDSHRDMILRSYVLDDNMLTWNQMGVFGKNSLGNESVYNSGFALTRYIAQKYGEDKLREITYKLGSTFNFTIDAAFEDVLGKSGNEIYDEWSGYLKEDYSKRVEDIKSNPITGEMIAGVGFGNFYPVFSQDGGKIFYISNKKNDYFRSSLYQYDIETRKEKLIQSNIRSTIALIPDTDGIIYAKLSHENPNWVNIHDLYRYDIGDDKEIRLTHGLRANNPAVSNDGKKIVFIYQKDGTTNLGVVDIDGKNFNRLTFFENGEQVFNPEFSPDDSYVVFDYSYHQGRDLARVNIDGSDYKMLISTPADERNSFYAPDGKLYYSSDETGIFNIYSYDEAAGKAERKTNVLGGAFMPALNGNGDLVYSGYTSDGYKIFMLDAGKIAEVDESKKYYNLDNPPLGKDFADGGTANFNVDRLRNFNDYELPDYESKPYSGSFTRLTFFPLIRFDNYNTSNDGLDRWKLGLYVASSDILNRYAIFGGAAVNKRFERDLFLIFEYRNKLPLLFDLGLKPELALELYSVSRKTTTPAFFGVDSTTGDPVYDYEVPLDITYDLFEVDVVARHKIFNPANTLELRFVWSRYVAEIGSFIFPGTTQLYPTTKDEYFIGRNFGLKFTHNGLIPHKDSDINPIGREMSLWYNFEFNKFNQEGNYVVEDGLLKPVYENFNFHRLEFYWREHLEIFEGHTLSTRFRLGTILGPAVPDFFDFYLGGLIGMQAYPFYSVSGNELAWLNITYRFPLWRNIDARAGHLYIDKIFIHLFGDYGNAWTVNPNESLVNFSDFKKGAGFGIRIKMSSFYLFPTSLFFSGAYSFDKFERVVRGETITYGREWRLYGGILFDFNF